MINVDMILAAVLFIAVMFAAMTMLIESTE